MQWHLNKQKYYLSKTITVAFLTITCGTLHSAYQRTYPYTINTVDIPTYRPRVPDLPDYTPPIIQRQPDIPDTPDFISPYPPRIKGSGKWSTLKRTTRNGPSISQFDADEIQTPLRITTPKIPRWRKIYNTAKKVWTGALWFFVRRIGRQYQEIAAWAAMHGISPQQMLEIKFNDLLDDIFSVTDNIIYASKLINEERYNDLKEWLIDKATERLQKLAAYRHLTPRQLALSMLGSPIDYAQLYLSQPERGATMQAAYMQQQMPYTQYNPYTARMYQAYMPHTRGWVEAPITPQPIETADLYPDQTIEDGVIPEIIETEVVPEIIEEIPTAIDILDW